MNRRIMDVTASTTLDIVRGTVHGLDWVEEATAVVDVGTTGDDDSPAVTLDLEHDPTALTRIDAHADTLRLSATEARTLAAALTDAAGRVEGGTPADE